MMFVRQQKRYDGQGGSEGRIAIVVLHDLTFAARWADKIIVMKNGALHAAGSPDAAITPEMLASIYGVEAMRPRLLAGHSGRPKPCELKCRHPPFSPLV
ncbi:ABC transporter ATP-binding protein [Bradyrhizobium sp. 170]|uniref:ABC transporter ATP-binding protein n=1 Tax=Bradyrhizobium sp. 170 TaxID=2782641 RepID=UPI001FFFA863|nr:ABC transporter ATP-binding protein [Bradyrhizobium sp. 170]UPK02453.1 ABC transporter ATP-binding protein [Bradyrhizobium sp. 170]